MMNKEDIGLTIVCSVLGVILGFSIVSCGQGPLIEAQPTIIITEAAPVAISSPTPTCSQAPQPTHSCVVTWSYGNGHFRVKCVN